MTSVTTGAATATHTAMSSNNSPGDAQSKPLLFFVALGFGVVFTNLWIIVGVKYCFRYNRRARQLAALGPDGVDGLGLTAMPRPRRRREKKLMSMEEVNARFPLTKYKLWRATREQQGLPTNGGVTATPSRAPSVKDIGLERPSTENGISLHDKDMATTPITRPTSNHHPSASVDLDYSHAAEGPSSPTAHEKITDMEAARLSPQQGPTPDRNTTVDDELDEDDPIRTAVPPELLAEPGDACAICLDSLDDDDEVRGLTCGHAFHASCLDPWLTSRRACCPLCKAEYYVPKPRPDGEAPQLEEGVRRAPIMPPANAWVGGRYLYAHARPTGPRQRVMIAGSLFTVEADRHGFPVLTRESRASRRQARQQQQQQEGQGQGQGQGLQQQPEQEGGADNSAQQQLGPEDNVATPRPSWFRSTFVNTSRNVPRLPRIPGLNRTTTGEQAPPLGDRPQTPTTPAQLEAGLARQ